MTSDDWIIASGGRIANCITAGLLLIQEVLERVLSNNDMRNDEQILERVLAKRKAGILEINA